MQRIGNVMRSFINGTRHTLNHQYQTLVSTNMTFDQSSECSIFFQVDGPYRCYHFLQNKLLKKRYEVFNEDGSLSELKGFELEVIKKFQKQVFQHIVDRGTLEECHDSVENVASYWLKFWIRGMRV